MIRKARKLLNPRILYSSHPPSLVSSIPRILSSSCPLFAPRILYSSHPLKAASSVPRILNPPHPFFLKVLSWSEFVIVIPRGWHFGPYHCYVICSAGMVQPPERERAHPHLTSGKYATWSKPLLATVSFSQGAHGPSRLQKIPSRQLSQLRRGRQQLLTPRPLWRASQASQVVSYTHHRGYETVLDIVSRPLFEYTTRCWFFVGHYFM